MIFDAFTKAKTSSSASKTYQPQGPPASGIVDCGSYDHPDHGCSEEDADGDAAALQSLLFVLTDDIAYANTAKKILNQYAQGFKKYNNSNAPLQAGEFPLWPAAAHINNIQAGRCASGHAQLSCWPTATRAGLPASSRRLWRCCTGTIYR